MTKYEHRDPIDHIQDLFEQRSNTNDMLFRSTLKGEILRLCDTFECYTCADDAGHWYEHGIVNGTIILVVPSGWWAG